MKMKQEEQPLLDSEKQSQEDQNLEQKLEGIIGLVKEDSTNSLLTRGNNLLNKKEYKEAIEAYDKAIEINPQDYSALNNKGLALLYSGNEKEATNCFKKALATQNNKEDESSEEIKKDNIESKLNYTPKISSSPSKSKKKINFNFRASLEKITQTTLFGGLAYSVYKTHDYLIDFSHKVYNGYDILLEEMKASKYPNIELNAFFAHLIFDGLGGAVVGALTGATLMVGASIAYHIKEFEVPEVTDFHYGIEDSLFSGETVLGGLCGAAGGFIGAITLGPEATVYGGCALSGIYAAKRMIDG
ncbi:tetratricopeptide repeat protein [Candidatus Woesearchaeota archaeon]|nr:tetratricopeptide repeat protein [Candidatus Woesearchaeota archaeon]